MHLYPIAGVALTWYRGHQVVKTDFDSEETDEELYNIVSILSVNGTEVVEGVEFRCELTLHVGQETFTRVASLVASAEGEYQEGLGTSTPVYPILWSQPSLPCAPQNSSAKEEQPPLLHHS